MSKVIQIIGQIVLYGLFMAVVGYLSTSPSYNHMATDTSLIKISLAHTSEPNGECVKQTPEQLAKLPPNMQMPVVCPRERSPIFLELELDGEVVHSETIMPSGLHRDAAGYTYQKIKVPSGRHRLGVKMRDSVDSDEFDYIAEEDIDMSPAEIVVVDFDAKHGKFIFE